MLTIKTYFMFVLFFIGIIFTIPLSSHQTVTTTNTNQMLNSGIKSPDSGVNMDSSPSFITSNFFLIYFSFHSTNLNNITIQSIPNKLNPTYLLLL